MKNAIVLAMMGFALSGCAVASAYWQKPTKYKGLPDKSDGAGPDPAVASLSMDASRRLVLSQKVDTTPQGLRFTCPEPPPDIANNTLAQTLAKLETKAGTNASVGSAYQVIAQVLHARTARVEIWRTSSSMYCVLLMNKMYHQAGAYLAAAGTVMADTKDAEINEALAQAFVDGLSGFGTSQVAGEQAGNVNKAPTDAAALTKEELAAAVTACAKVADNEKGNNADCKKVKMATQVSKTAATN